MRDRAFRRAQQERIKARTFRFLRDSWNYTNYASVEETWEKARRMCNNRAVCSCYSCRNQRRNPWESRSRKRTMQERRQFQDDGM